jgi:hypothetical protein
VITFVQCVRRRPEVAPAEFQRHWESYGEQIRALAEASNALRFSLSRVLAVKQNLAVMASRGTSEPFDGLVQISWTSGSSAMADVERAFAGSAIVAMQRHQAEFMDLPRCSFFFTFQDVAFDRP